MHKYDESLKITALGVVIFSFVSLLIGAGVLLVIDAIAALLVLKTDLPESCLRIFSVIGCGMGTIVAASFLTAKAKIKGIYAAGIVALLIFAIKLIGNHFLINGSYLSMNGLLGMLFVAVFSLIGGVVGSNLKR